MAGLDSAGKWLAIAVVIAPLLIAGGFVAISWLAYAPQPASSGPGAPPAPKKSLKARLGPANWDFTSSFGSSLTVIGAVLGTILSASVLPSNTTLPASTYAGLNLLFGVVIVVGPFLYTATQTPAPAHKSSAATEPQFQGRVWGFLVATVLTLWAVFGELATMGLIFREIYEGKSLPGVVLWVLVGLLLVSVICLFFLAWQRIEATLKDQVANDSLEHRTAVKRQLEQMRVADVPPVDEIRPSRRSWSVL